MNRAVRGWPWRSTASVTGAIGIALGVWLLIGQPGARAGGAQGRDGGVVRVAMRGADIDSLDPALSYSVAAWSLLEPTCLRLMRTPLETEAAAGLPVVSRDGRTYTFSLRNGFRFSDGTPVRANAFARAIARTLVPGVQSPWAAYTREIVGAPMVLAGRASSPAGVVASGNRLVVRLERDVPEFVAFTTSLCAVPPTLPANREGVNAFPGAGPYYVDEYRAGERAVLRRNPYYSGSRPHHVDTFTVDLTFATHEAVLDRVEDGRADWGWALAQAYFDPARRLVAKYGVNRSRFFVRPGATFRGYAFNTSRPLFRDNPRLRRAVSFAIDRSVLRRVSGGRASSTLTDQYLPSTMAGYRDARIYPLRGRDLRRARVLARGNTRSGKLTLYTIAFPHHLAFAQSIKQNLAEIGLDVSIRGIPLEAYFGRFMARGAYDLGFATWTPDFDDPYGVLNIQLDGRFIGATNWARFDSAKYNRLLRRAAALHGEKRSRFYGQLDVRLAREAAPMVAVDYLNDATLVSRRLGCIRQAFDLAAVCLK